MSSVSHDQLLAELRKRMANEEPLPGENYFQEDETLVRFLKAREWNVDSAEKQLREAVAWRRSYKPLTADCRWCQEKPGCHSMRQVGFDESGRPVIYSCFAQADASRNNVEDSIAHCTYLIENAKRTMRPGVTTWIFVIDCTGLSLPLCNPSLASGVVSVFSNYYPEQMERIVCVNHSALFHGVWNAIKVLVDPKTAKKMKFIRGKEKMKKKFGQLFGDPTAAWLLEEVRLNRQEPLPEAQERFWEGPMRPGLHDPRGCQEYVEQCVDPYFVRVMQAEVAQGASGGGDGGDGGGEAAAAAAAGLSRPHPNIVAQQTGRMGPYESRFGGRRKAAAAAAAAERSSNSSKQQPGTPVGATAPAVTEAELAAYGVASLPSQPDSDESDED